MKVLLRKHILEIRPILSLTIYLSFCIVYMNCATAITFGTNVVLKTDPIPTNFRQKFNKCSCLILHDNLGNFTGNRFDSLFVNAASNSAGVYLLNMKSSDFTSMTSFTQRNDVAKTRPQCTLGVIYISNQFAVKKLPDWFNFLQSSHGIVKVDFDQFLILGHTETVVDTALISESFGKRIKFAIGISMNSENQNPSIRFICHWCINSSQMSTTFTFDDSLFSDKTKNFQRKVLTVSTPTSTRWLNEMHHVDGKWIPKRGIYSIVLDQLMIRYNFTSEFMPSTGGGTGAKVNKTIWVGTVGDVLYSKADIGHVTASTLSRCSTVDCTFPISYEWLTFTTGKAPEYHTWKTIYWPFTPLIWQLTALTSIICVLIFKIVLKFTRQKTSLAKVIEYMFAVVMEEGVKDPEQFPTYSLRITMLVWLIFGLLMGTAYRSKLTAFLAFPHVEHLPDSFEELATSKYSIGLQYIKGAAYQILKRSKNPVYMSIFKRMELEESDVRCFKRTIDSKFACISWDSIADYAYHKNLTDKFGNAPVVKSPASTCFLTAGMVLPKHSILKTNFDHFLIWAMDTGMMIKWRRMDHDYVATQRKHWEKETNQPEISYAPTENEALTVSHLSGGCYLFLVGVICSLISFFVEKIYNQYQKCMGFKILSRQSTPDVTVSYEIKVQTKLASNSNGVNGFCKSILM